jgi:iron complex transport system substrate-binding protein
VKRSLTIGIAFMLSLGAVFAQDSAGSCGAGLRQVEHALGEMCAPENPQRVVALDMTIVELLLIAGEAPVAASQTVLEAWLRMHPELEDTFADLMTTAADTGFPPNIEVILDAQPDLIIGPRDLFTESIYPELSAIAPTVLYEPAPGNWRRRFIFGGGVLGLDDHVESLLADYDARREQLRGLVADLGTPVEVSLVRTFPGQIGLVLEGTAAAALLNDVGITRPEAQTLDYETVLETLDGRPELLISQEELLLADGDVIFVFGDAAHLEGNPLWNALPAVQAGRAFEVGYYWWGDSLVSAHDMLDDLYRYIVVAESELANPFAAGLETEPTESSTQRPEQTPPG